MTGCEKASEKYDDIYRHPIEMFDDELIGKKLVNSEDRETRSSSER